MNDEHRDDAVLFALGQLEDPEARALADEASRDPGLATLITEYRATLAVLALSAEATNPPPGLRDSILAVAARDVTAGEPEITPTNHPADQPAPVVPPTPRWNESLYLEMMPWCLAACLAIGCAVLAYHVSALYRENTSLLASRGDWASLRLAVLAPSDPASSSASGRALWNEPGGVGVFESDSLPVLGATQVYQLWIFEEGNPAPVPAGFFDPSNGQRTPLRPIRPVKNVAAVAVSIEVTGGKPQPEGPVVLVGAVGKAG